MYVWICDVKGCHLCMVERNQSGILLFVVSEEVLSQAIQRQEVQLPLTITRVARMNMYISSTILM